MRQLLTHTSSLQNELVKAYHVLFSTAEFVQHFVAKDDRNATSAFNYNNIDYNYSGFVTESRVISRLAYGYHNYTFDAGSAKDTLSNDRRIILTNTDHADLEKPSDKVITSIGESIRSLGHPPEDS